MRSTLICTLLALAGLAPLAAQEPPTDDLVARLMAIAGPRLNPDGKKQSLRVTQKRLMKVDGDVGWVLQAEWTEAGEARKGVVVAGRVAQLPKGVEFVAQVDGWGMTPLMPDRAGQDVDSVVAGMKRGRVQANEAATVGDLRAILNREHSYTSANSGYFDTLSCLVTPTKCIPGYPASGTTFLSQDMMVAVMGDKSGYRRKFHAGAKVANPGRDASSSSLAAFALTAVPIRAGETGVRGVCVDSSNIVCFTPDGREPRVVDGACPVSKGCEPDTPLIRTSEAAPKAAAEPAVEAAVEAARRADAWSSRHPVSSDPGRRLARILREDAERAQASEPQEVCARHILVKVESRPRQPGGQPEAEARGRAQAVLTSLGAGTDFAELARKSSEDAGTASRGGDFGCFPRGRLVQEVEDAAFGLQVGETSGLVRTPAGFHVIQRTTRGAPEDARR